MRIYKNFKNENDNKLLLLTKFRMDIKLFAPGPVYVPKKLLNEMSKPNDTHRCEAYKKLHCGVRKKLQTLLHTQNDVLLWTGSGSLVMEACIKSLINEDSRALILSCGNFGERWIDMAKANSRKIDVGQIEWGRAFTSDIVQKYYNNHSLVFITMNESSTGVMNPVWELRKIISNDTILVVDAVSCMAGCDIDVDKWGIDVCFASTQKCFGLPAGMSVSSVSSRVFKHCESVSNRGWYTDFLRMRESSLKDYTPSTPNINCLRALNSDLDMIQCEGYQYRFDRHIKNTKLIWQWAKTNGFQLFAQQNYESPTITVISNTRGINIEGVLEKLLQRGYRFANGYGKLANKTFRIAGMGWIKPQQMKYFLNEFNNVINGE